MANEVVCGSCHSVPMWGSHVGSLDESGLEIEVHVLGHDVEVDVWEFVIEIGQAVMPGFPG